MSERRYIVGYYCHKGRGHFEMYADPAAEMACGGSLAPIYLDAEDAAWFRERSILPPGRWEDERPESKEPRQTLADTLRQVIWRNPAPFPNSPAERQYLDAANALLKSEWLARIVREARAEGWDERSKARPQYLGPDDGHWSEDCAGWSDCHCGSFPNPYSRNASETGSILKSD